MLSLDGDKAHKKLISEFENACAYNGKSLQVVLEIMIDDYIYGTDMNNMKNNSYIHDLLRRQEKARNDAE